MIMLCGIPSEPPVEMVRTALDELGLPYVMLNQRQFAQAAIAFQVVAGQVTGRLRIGEQTWRLEDFSGIYTRMTDYQMLPELHLRPADDPLVLHAAALHDGLARWYEVAPLRVMNRTAAMMTNFSKPFQAQLIRRCGLFIPETLITNDPHQARDFYAQHRHVIYKSISGIRSIVQTLTEADLTRLDRIRWCPTQFQRFIEGTNVRVHVVGDQVFATRIETTVTDYRYASQQGGETTLSACELDESLRLRCIELARSLGFELAGIDLKITPDNEVYCFEVNPSPAFSYYQSHTSQPIAQAIARYLSAEPM